VGWGMKEGKRKAKDEERSKKPIKVVKHILLEFPDFNSMELA
jgi:hypothetical protein